MSLFYQENNKHPQEVKYPDVGQNPKQQPETFKKQSNDPRASVFINKQQQPQKQPGCCAKLCKCFTLEYYKDYFKVTNADVKKRIVCNLKFWAGGFFNPKQQQYDLYGPFWLYTTLIFMLSAVQNILTYENSKNSTFSYNFQGLGTAFTVFYIFGFGVSALIGFLLKCSSIDCTIIQIVCLYGYSVPNYIICILLCSFNYTLLTWLFLIYACAAKIAYILKNIFQSMQVPTTKKLFITVVVVAQAAIQLLIIKLAFIRTQGASGSALSHLSYLHLRNFAL